ncbi:hypothetical protein C5745_08035 [Sphingobacterium haloxyli]|uniref:Uncharacterized protein n=1 Tax=Sphingobacterium haloxyli TaxID=2100533 RepID=A0A2S9J4Y4_9SPHI|nr:hypothetical protein C5745_08035 [Sphingobacterium haloxyli]
MLLRIIGAFGSYTKKRRIMSFFIFFFTVKKKQNRNEVELTEGKPFYILNKKEAELTGKI